MSKLGLLWDPLVQNRKYMSSCVMTVKNDTKIEEELACFKIDMRNLTKLDLSTQKSPKFAL